MTGHLDKLADDLFYCLGKSADSIKEITQRMVERTKLRTIKPAAVEYLIGYVRRNNLRLGWTIPHVKRGKTVRGEGRFVRMLDDGKTTVLDREADRQKIEDGLYGTVMQTSQMNANEARAITVCVQNTNSRLYRAWLEDLAEECEALSKKAKRIAKIIKLNRENGKAA